MFSTRWKQKSYVLWHDIIKFGLISFITTRTNLNCSLTISYYAIYNVARHLSTLHDPLVRSKSMKWKKYLSVEIDIISSWMQKGHP